MRLPGRKRSQQASPSLFTHSSPGFSFASGIQISRNTTRAAWRRDFGRRAQSVAGYVSRTRARERMQPSTVTVVGRGSARAAFPRGFPPRSTLGVEVFEGATHPSRRDSYGRDSEGRSPDGRPLFVPGTIWSPTAGLVDTDDTLHRHESHEGGRNTVSSLRSSTRFLLRHRGSGSTSRHTYISARSGMPPFQSFSGRRRRPAEGPKRGRASSIIIQ
ncbi:hypothetical protein C8R45DRAFT_252310 [Mycena sanguinolenta]|nr:hypothetical protein C8R45DRAFT_252310 [Mycena sanguinolenta]